MSRKLIRVMSAADYSYVSRGGAVTYPVPFAITLGKSKGVSELDIYKAPLKSVYEPEVKETTHVRTFLVGHRAKYRLHGTEKYDCEVVAITARKVTLRPLNIVPAEYHYKLNLDGTLVEDMAEFCESNVE